MKIHVWSIWPNFLWNLYSRKAVENAFPAAKAQSECSKFSKQSPGLAEKKTIPTHCLRFQGVMQLRQLAETIKDTSLCGLGQTAPNPVLSTPLNWFRDEYEAHIFDRQCPAGPAKNLSERHAKRLPGRDGSLAICGSYFPRRI